MTTVEVKTSDGVIWNKDQVIINIIAASQKGPVVLDLLSEGPCCQHAGVDSMLDQIVENFNIDPETFTILTSNQIPSSKYKETKATFIELTHIKDLAKTVKPISDKKDFWFPWKASDKFTKKFAIFIGRSNWQRLGLASYIWAHAPTESTITYHYDPAIDYHRSNFGLEQFINRHWEHKDQAYNFTQVLPLKFDDQTYPILWDKAAFDINQYYEDVFCEVVCETYFSGRTFFVTEKTFRCILNRRPFLVQGSKYFLKNLQRLGFKTFDHWWSEGYDLDPADCKYENLIKVIDYINSQPMSTIKQWHNEMDEVLEHNYNTLVNLTYKELRDTEFYYD